jgi:hypothetical protein
MTSHTVSAICSTLPGATSKAAPSWSIPGVDDGVTPLDQPIRIEEQHRSAHDPIIKRLPRDKS